MRNTKLLLKSAALAACVTFGVSAEAQTLIGPSNPDIPWYTACTPGVGVYIAGINTAMIDCGGDIKRQIRPSTLAVSDYYGNGTAGGVSFRDINSGFTQTIQYCNVGAPGYFGASPDIIVGNDAANPTTDYRVAAAYRDAFSGQAVIDYYLVHYTGTGIFAPPTYLGSTTFPGFTPTTIHLDVIADYASTGVTGMPWCNAFVVTWDDLTTNKSYAAIASLNSFPAIITASPMITLNSGTGGAVSMPDVAGIRRWVSSCASCSPTIDYVSLFTTVENGNQVFYQEYDWSTTTFLTPPMPQGPVFASGVMWPRIDAPDDYNVNSPSTPNLCYYKAVVQASAAPGVYQSIVFDNMSPGGQDDAWYMPHTTGMYTPTVAYGGFNGTEYQVSHYADEFAGSGPAPNIFMEPINWMFPNSTTIPDNAIAWQPYFQVNLATLNFANGNFMNSISTPCNNPSHLTLCAWADNVTGAAPTATVYYKVTPYGGVNGYSFKHANGEPATVAAEWKVYPNPADNMLNVENGFVGTYDITDVTGRKVGTGDLTAGKQTIDLSSLVPGSYVITSYSNGIRKNYSVFVKQ